MENKETEGNLDEIVDALIKLPINNLEERIENIMADIKKRNSIFDSSLSVLAKREIEIKAHLWKMRYCLGNELNRKLTLENELANIRNTKMNNTISHFHDDLKLRENLQSAKEQLSLEKEKRKLVG